MSDLVWAAGLFVGEGACFVITRKPRTVGGRVYPGGEKYLSIAVLMADERAVRRFQMALTPHLEYRRKGKRAAMYDYIPSNTRPNAKRVYRWGVVNTPAVSAMRALYPYMQDTDKGDQVKACFDTLGLDL